MLRNTTRPSLRAALGLYREGSIPEWMVLILSAGTPACSTTAEISALTPTTASASRYFFSRIPLCRGYETRREWISRNESPCSVLKIQPRLAALASCV